MKNIYTLYIFMLIFICFTQNIQPQSKFGNVTMDEMNLSVCPLDTSASAVMLLKVGDTRFVYNSIYGFQFEYTIQTKIKILKSEGLEWADQEVGYYQESNSRKEDIRGLSGTTYNLENGKITKTKLSKEHIFDEESEKKLKLKKFTMPAAKVGSVIEYKYTIVSDFFYDLRDFNFQASIPILYTSYEITIPEYFRFNTNYQGYVRLDTRRTPENESFSINYKDGSGRTQTHTERCAAERISYEAKDVPSIKKEVYLWTIRDYITKVSFELKSIQYPHSLMKTFAISWEKIDEDLLEASYFGGNAKKADMFKNEVSKGETTLSRAKEIQDMIKNKVKWNDKNTAFPRDMKNALKNGTGTSAEVNFLLINALQAGGFDAFPVLMSTRSNGRMPITHPSVDAFNYTITGIRIDTMTYFTDAAAKYGDWNLLPEKCMVPQARIMKRNNTEWVDLTMLANSSILKTSIFSFTDSKYEGKVTDTRKGCTAYNARASYSNHKDEKDYIESLKKNLACEIDGFSITNLENTGEPLKMEYVQSIDAALGDEFLYISPLQDKLYSENPFKEEKRVFPVQFNYPMNYVQLIEIDIPEGYVVDELPKAERILFNENEISFTYRIAQSGNKVKLHYQYQLRKLQFLPDEYESLRDFFAKIVLKNSEQVVLKKAAI
ncbi:MULTISPECIES: DUF3857 domain-containing protein [unclassified Dysgonomonas]|uniref:DUF3857 domain-containing protein n=1 Tax=unclassified Dysgonomonas TaxID=2630389 RepID=UPI002473B321|nr:MULTISPECIES: DUF3857 domain-containing protein [unclassified Dysgonomonas]